jgi:flagellar motor switch protein FliN
MTSEIELTPLMPNEMFEDLTPDMAPLGADSLDAVQEVPVKVRAIIGRARMPIGDLVRLRPGSIVELDRRVGEPVDILINDRLVARGEIVLIDQALGVTLTEIVRTDA